MAKNHPVNIAVGKNKGHQTTKIQKKGVKQSRTKGKFGKRVKLIREITQEISGVAVFEKRAI